MKFINLKYLFVAGVLALSLSSCEDYLELMPSNALPSDNAINTIEDLESALNGVYDGLTSSSYYGSDFISRAEVGGEDVQTASQTKRTENYYRFMYRQANAPTGLWYVHYRVINRTNVLLQAIEAGNIPVTKELNNVKGEALAIRALCHFNLAIVYGYPYQKDKGASLGAPIVKNVLTANDMPSRNTVAECYKAVEDDLEEALSLVGSEINKGHFNKWAVLGLQARVNLYKGDYDKALQCAETIINESPYSLLKREEYVSSWSNEYTSESVFDLHISDLSSGDRELFGYLVDPDGYSAIAATDEFIDLVNEYDDDVRINLLSEDASGVKCIIKKYPGRGGVTTVNNVRIIRLSDIYLIAAEAALRKATPDQSKADLYLNTIRKRAISSANDITATLELIDRERRKELVLEGHRLYDILRVGNSVTRKGGRHFLSSVDLITPNWNDYRCVMPIPQAEIDANSNIKNQQNPEY